MQNPRSFYYNRVLRFFTVALAVSASAYTVYFILIIMPSDATWYRQLLPYAILFFALISLFRNFTDLNLVRFNADNVEFFTLLNRKRRIYYSTVTRVEFQSLGLKLFKIYYKHEAQEVMFPLTVYFPRMLEIINLFVQCCPQAAYDEFIRNVVPTAPVAKQPENKEVSVDEDGQ